MSRSLHTASLDRANDDSDLDGTDAAHPAWWRGQAYGAKRAAEMLERTLYGLDDGGGVFGGNELERVRRAILEFVASTAASSRPTIPVRSLTMTHAEQRLIEREPSIAHIPNLMARLQHLASDGRSHAVRLAHLGAIHGSWLGSSGNAVWAVVRNGRVVTIMRRRTDQPSTAAAMDVDKVHFSLADASNSK